MNEEHDWQLEAKLGLGELRFGMTPFDVDEFRSIYGVSKGLSSDAIPNNLFATTLADLGSGLSDEEKKEILALHQQMLPIASSQTEVRGGQTMLSFTYQAGHLVEILADFTASHLKCGDIAIFEGEPEDVIRRMAAFLNETPIISKEEVVFPGSFIYLFEFVRERPSPDGGAADYVTGNRSDRSIIWRASSRQGGVDLSTYKPMTL
jgi:hypothetical protein